MAGKGLTGFGEILWAIVPAAPVVSSEKAVRTGEILTRGRGSMTELVFRGREVKRLIAHALAQKKHYPTLGQLCEMQGLGPGDRRWPEKATTNSFARRRPACIWSKTKAST